MNYQIKPVAVEDIGDADGVHVNQQGAWLGEVDWQQVEGQEDRQIVTLYSDDDGDYIPAPENWRDLIVKAL